MWVHLFWIELYTLPARSKGTHWPIHASGLTFALRDRGSDMYPPCNMMTNNADWDKGWFYLHNDSPGLTSYTTKVLTDCPTSWAFGYRTLGG